MIDRFRYTPGDHHVYVWPGEGDMIKVYRIKNHATGMDQEDTGDRIDATDTARTLTAMVERVDRWRQARQVTGS
jgi:hypothetical protein